jgi:3-oxoacyl-[acyl-carrier protein] reductase
MTSQIVNTPGVKEAFNAETPLGRFGEIEDVVNAVVWLSSDAAGYITGQNLLIDGGASLRRLPRTEDIIRSIQAATAKA